MCVCGRPFFAPAGFLSLIIIILASKFVRRIITAYKALSMLQNGKGRKTNVCQPHRTMWGDVTGNTQLGDNDH